MARCEEIGEKDATLKADILRLKKEIEATESQLRKVTLRESMNVDAEALLASLEAVTGPRDPETRALEELEQRRSVDEELQKLKERLQKEGE